MLLTISRSVVGVTRRPPTNSLEADPRPKMTLLVVPREFIAEKTPVATSESVGCCVVGEDVVCLCGWLAAGVVDFESGGREGGVRDGLAVVGVVTFTLCTPEEACWSGRLNSAGETASGASICSEV